MSAEARLKQLGLTLPQVPAPLTNYLPYRIAGNLLFLAGQGPRGPDGSSLTGKVGGEVSVDEGYKRARLVGLQLLSATRMALDVVHGQRSAGFPRSSQGRQWHVRSVCRSIRRRRHARALSGWHGLATQSDLG